MTRTCSVPTCDRPVESRALCHTHRARLRYTGDVRADVPIASAVPGRGVTGCATCGADDVRPGPCQPWCERVRALVAS